jgi:hypothetical protein
MYVQSRMRRVSTSDYSAHNNAAAVEFQVPNSDGSKVQCITAHCNAVQ